MERLVINNFLILNHIDFEIKKFNIIIGSQGSGKSLIAKVVYFFRAMGAELESGIFKEQDILETQQNIVEKFEKIFPKYTWKNSGFEIDYYFENLKISINFSPNMKSLILKLPEEIQSDYSTLLQSYSNIKQRLDEKRKNRDLELSLNFGFIGVRRSLRKLIEESAYLSLFQQRNSRFIPASRAFFSVINENFFTMLSSKQSLDPFLIEFGETYESLKNFYNRQLTIDSKGEDRPLLEKSTSKISKLILNGEYQFYEDREWIVNGDNKVELIHASSGQQEALPLLIILSVLQYITNNKGSTFIEEPEAHLFPLSQGYIISLISNLYAQGKSFFITTHSPYILSELNNFIYAAELCKKGKLTQKMFEDLNLFGCPIKFEDVSAYTIEDGSLKSILDEDYKLINSDELDKASEHAEKVFSKLVALDVE